MTQALFLVSRSTAVGSKTVNGVQAVIINMVSTSSDAEAVAAAVALCALKYTAKFDTNYFDTVDPISISAARINEDSDGIVFANNAAPSDYEAAA